jgi:hypothetical protein
MFLVLIDLFVYRVSQKKIAHCVFLLIFQKMKFYKFIMLSYLRTITKLCLIIAKFDKVMRFQTRQPDDFNAVKTVCTLKQHSVTNAATKEFVTTSHLALLLLH